MPTLVGISTLLLGLGLWAWWRRWTHLTQRMHAALTEQIGQYTVEEATDRLGQTLAAHGVSAFLAQWEASKHPSTWLWYMIRHRRRREH